ncbi:hypothetical protein IAE35_10460 [Pseudomonas sp. S75]|uniref:hypothetical protein n=1 Tax=unclassified Pseudomonas TaxID=196821 RepID=UPI001902D05C|nr:MULTISPECIES: hypothetical protein [unclassified Pseudomonas]MBJ9976764.1 hypothetical protein [Pseudomonas sp. S30]MBK0153766.1 hypothetical protein [Pseudomonas sp. S75]
MPTFRQQSFLATLRLGAHPVHTLEALTGAAVWVNWFGGAGLLPGLTSTVRNDSHLLGCQASPDTSPLLLYFRLSPKGYRLYVREPGKHFGHGVRLFERFLGVAALDTQDPQPLILKDDAGKVVSLMDLEGDEQRLTFECAGAAVTLGQRTNSPHRYLAQGGAVPARWTLSIVERNVPWLSQPYEA